MDFKIQGGQKPANSSAIVVKMNPSPESPNISKKRKENVALCNALVTLTTSSGEKDTAGT